MSNIYLNEFDRFMKHELKPLAYLRYGDDWLCFVNNRNELEQLRTEATNFLMDNLSLTINPKINRLQPARQGVSYLGVDIWPNGHRLQKPVRQRIIHRLDKRNASNYRALVEAHEQSKWLKYVHWRLLDLP
jgi:hypothetical protein